MKTNQQPESKQSITTFFLDIGGVLLTNGWWAGYLPCRL